MTKPKGYVRPVKCQKEHCTLPARRNKKYCSLGHSPLGPYYRDSREPESKKKKVLKCVSEDELE